MASMPDHTRDHGPSTEIEDAVLGYLHAHPEAADTLDGITRWWLPTQRYVNARSRIDMALQRLVEQGALRPRRLPDGSVLYSLDTPRPPRSHT